MGDFQFRRKQKAAGLGCKAQHRKSAWTLKYLYEFFAKSARAARSQHQWIKEIKGSGSCEVKKVCARIMICYSGQGRVGTAAGSDL